MINTIEDLLNIEPYSLNKQEKERALNNILKDRTYYHYNHCKEYKKIIDSLNFDINSSRSYYDLPMIPVRLFKEYELLSVERDQVTKIMTSSGTSSQQVSKIFLDRINTINQTKVLTKIINSFIGRKRLPLIILDTPMVKKDRSMFSARGAGIIGFSVFGRNIFYALDENMKLNVEGLNKFIEEHNKDNILMFGYTYMIWEYCLNELKRLDIKMDINKGKLFHIGGWKKLKNQQVDAITYNNTIKDRLGNVDVYNYYGMAEQLGSVFVECEYGHMHCSNFSDVIIRRSKDFSCASTNERGIIELVSTLPTSYPGHVLLTEDEGEILGEDNCPCGRLGKYFKIHGRIKNAEIRGCSDTYERK